jgi:hypothetical protein
MSGATRARIANIGLGGWLIASAFLWRDPPQTVNTLVTGGLVALVAAIAMLGVFSWLRGANVALAAWLFWSTILMRATYGATVLNQVLVSMAVTVFAFFPWWSVPLDVDEPTPVLALRPV